jgi:hypothetical protein
MMQNTQDTRLTLYFVYAYALGTPAFSSEAKPAQSASRSHHSRTARRPFRTNPVVTFDIGITRRLAALLASHAGDG